MCILDIIICCRNVDHQKRRQTKAAIAVEMRCYRRILNVSRKEHRTNESIRDEVQCQETITDIIDITRKRKLTLFGHNCRMSDQRPMKMLLIGMVSWRCTSSLILSFALCSFHDTFSILHNITSRKLATFV